MTIAIVGPGLIGASVAQAARRADPDVSIIEIDRGQSLDPASAAEIVVLATPIDVILDIIARHASSFSATAILDTGSTKRAIVAAATAAGLRNFVGGHPMAGAASSGPAEARADLFDGKPWFLVPHQAQPAASGSARTFVQTLGAVPIVLDDDGGEHDRVMAAVSHLPQVVASALMTAVGKSVGERGLAWAGAGLRDTTRLASSSASMWESLLASNADELRPLLRDLGETLVGLSDRLDHPDVIQSLFENANQYRTCLEVTTSKFKVQS